jgi:hypothetical protein
VAILAGKKGGPPFFWLVWRILGMYVMADDSSGHCVR